MPFPSQQIHSFNSLDAVGPLGWLSVAPWMSSGQFSFQLVVYNPFFITYGHSLKKKEDHICQLRIAEGNMLILLLKALNPRVPFWLYISHGLGRVAEYSSVPDWSAEGSWQMMSFQWLHGLLEGCFQFADGRLNWQMALVEKSSSCHKMWPNQRTWCWTMVWKMFGWLAGWSSGGAPCLTQDRVNAPPHSMVIKRRKYDLLIFFPKLCSIQILQQIQTRALQGQRMVNKLVGLIISTGFIIPLALWQTKLSLASSNSKIS